jgi:hypothetical protein
MAVTESPVRQQAAGKARTPTFRACAERFRDYAISLLDRRQSVPGIFMAARQPTGCRAAQVLSAG